MKKEKILSAVTLLTIAASSTIGVDSVLAAKGNIQDVDKCVYFALENERSLTSEKLNEILVGKGFTLKTELTDIVGTGTQIEVEKDGVSYTYTVVLLGDTNGDGKLSAQDISRIRKYKIGAAKEVTKYEELAMDVNGDKKITTQDISKLRKILIGKEEAIIPEEQLPEVDVVAMKKQEAINTINENYPQANYYEEDYTPVTDAIALINSEELATVEAVESYLEEIKSTLDEIQTKQEKLDAKVGAAKTELEELRAAYTAADYVETELDDIKTIIDTAIDNLDNLTVDTATLTDVDTIVENAKTAIDSVKTKLDLAKETAINTINENYPQANYYEEDYTPVTDAIALINSEELATVEAVESYLEEIKSTLDEIQTKQEKLDAKVGAAKTELEELRAAYTAADYVETELDDIKAIIDTAIDNLDNLTVDAATLTDVDTIVENAKTAIDSVKTKLDLAKEAAKSNLDSYISTEISQDDYSEENWNKILELVSSGKNTIDEVTKVTDTDTALRNVQIIKEDTITEIAAIDSIEDALEELKETKKQEITVTIPDESLVKFTEDQQNEISTLKSDAIENITSATTAEEVNEIAETTITALLAFRTDAQNDAIAAIDEKYVKEDYYSQDWAEIIEIINTAKSDIAKAEDTAIQAIVDQLDTDLSSYKTIAEQLTEAIEAATSELAEDYPEANYDAETWALVSTELEAQIELINSKITKTQVNIALENAKAALDEFETKAQKITNAKNAAIEAIDTALNECSEEDYSPTNWVQLNYKANYFKEQINNEDDVDRIATLKETALRNMAATLTIAQEELNTAKTDAKAAITEEFAKYNDIIANGANVYREENIGAITNLNAGAADAIDALTTVAEVNAKKDKIIQDMKDVKKIKQEELETAIGAEGDYAEADYYADDWADINAIVAEAINTIKGSYVAGDINTAYDNAIVSIEAIETKEKALASAKTDACAAIDAKARVFDGTDADAAYTDTELGELVTSLKAEINAAITPTKVAELQEAAIASLENYFATIQTNAKSAIDAKVTELELDANVEALANIITSAKTAIDESTTIDDVNTAKTNAIDDIVAYATLPDENA